MPFFLYGLGNNGKSTFLNIIRKMAGDYGDTMSTEVLMHRERYAGGPREPLANLKGKRLVVASEVEQGRRLNVSVVKDLTGSDPIKADRKYEHEVEFWPTHKLWIRGNHKPIITDTTLAIWRRMRVIPFTVTIPPEEVDLGLEAALESELPGILGWAVKGCMEWQEGKFTQPTAVAYATGTYRIEQDILHDFCEECCVFELDATVTKKELYQTYKEWCEARGEKPVHSPTFREHLIERKVEQSRATGGVRCWKGIRLATEGDRVTEVTKFPENPLYKEKGEESYENTVTSVTPATKSDGTSVTRPDFQRSLVEFWWSQGAPLVHLGPAENCEHLENLLSNHNILPRHLEAVMSWAKERGWNPEEESEMPDN